VTVAQGATITGKGFLTYDNECEVVRLNGGHLTVNGGTVMGAYNSCRQPTPVDGKEIEIWTTTWGETDPAIRIMQFDDHFYLESGTVYGDIYCDTERASLVLNGGELKTASLWDGFKNPEKYESRQERVRRKIPPLGWIDARIKSRSTVYINGTVPYADIWGIWGDDDANSVTTKGDGFAITLLGNATVYTNSKLYTKLRINAPDKTYNDVLVRSSNSYKLTKDDKNLVQLLSFGKEGEDEEMDQEERNGPLYLTNNTIVIYYDDILPWLEDLKKKKKEGDDTGDKEDNPATLKVPCEGMPMNGDAEFDDINYFLLTGEMPDEDCEGTIQQNDGNVTVGTGTTLTLTHLNWIGCGCSKHIYVYGTLIIDVNIHITNMLRFVHVRPGGRVVIRDLYGTVTNEIVYVDGGTVEYRGGSVSSEKYGWYCVSGTIYIYGGIIKGGIRGGYTAAGSVTYIHGGIIEGGFDNYGVTHWYGGTVNGGTTYTIRNYQGGTLYIRGGKCTGPGTIWSSGTIYLDGGTNVIINDIYIALGCRIYITSKLTYTLRLHISASDIVLGQPIILGGEGYTLTAEDCKKIELTLPKGYEWKYDEILHAIVISSKADTNGDNTIDVADISTIISYMAGERNGIELKQVDANGDGTVDVADIAIVISMMAEK